MATIKTGQKRSLTFQIIKQANGVMVTGYPVTYYGQKAFTYNGTLYPLISKDELSLMNEANFTVRLLAFQNFVKLSEPGIDFSTDILAGFEASMTDLGDCPPPLDVTTTTSTAPPVTTTTTTLPRRSINISVSYGGTTGDTNGIEGEISVCSVLWNVPAYSDNITIATTSVASQSCMADFSNLVLKLLAIQQTAYIYYREVGDIEWIDISSNKYIVIPAISSLSVNLEVYISNVAKEIVCNHFELIKTDWEDNQKGYFDVMLCDGTETRLEVLNGNSMLVCLYDAIPVNPQDTVVILGPCPSPTTTVPPTTTTTTTTEPSGSITVDIINESTDMVITNFGIAGMSLTDANFPLSAGGGTTTGTYSQPGTFQAYVEVSSNLYGHKVTLTDGNGTVHCWQIMDDTSYTFENVVLQYGIPVTVRLLDGSC